MLARWPDLKAEILPGQSVIGGGSTPQQSLPTWLMALKGGDAVGIERRLRLGTPPVVARIEEDRVVLDLRTVLPEEEEGLAGAVLRATA